MIKFFLVTFITWLIGIWGWAQIIGSIQNLRTRGILLIPLILWIVIMGAIAFLSIITYDSLWALIIGYALSFFQILASGKIE